MSQWVRRSAGPLELCSDDGVAQGGVGAELELWNCGAAFSGHGAEAQNSDRCPSGKTAFLIIRFSALQRSHQLSLASVTLATNSVANLAAWFSDRPSANLAMNLLCTN